MASKLKEKKRERKLVSSQSEEGLIFQGSYFYTSAANLIIRAAPFAFFEMECQALWPQDANTALSSRKRHEPLYTANIICTLYSCLFQDSFILVTVTELCLG